MIRVNYWSNVQGVSGSVLFKNGREAYAYAAQKLLQCYHVSFDGGRQYNGFNAVVSHLWAPNSQRGQYVIREATAR